MREWKIGEKALYWGDRVRVLTDSFSLSINSQRYVVIECGVDGTSFDIVTVPIDKLEPLPVVQYSPLSCTWERVNCGTWRTSKDGMKPEQGWLVRTDGVITGWEPA